MLRSRLPASPSPTKPRHVRILLSTGILAALLGLPRFLPGAVSSQAMPDIQLAGPRTAGSAGGLVTYTLSVSNRGANAAEVGLVGGGDWPAAMPEPVTIEAGGAATLVAGFEVPPAAADGDIAALTVAAEVDGLPVAEMELAAWLGGRASLGRQVGCRYDLDHDGAVTLEDVDRVEAAVGRAAGEAGHDPNLDFDHSGAVDRGDVERVVDRLRPACEPLVGAVDSTALQEAVTVEALRGHLERLQAIADANGGNRAARTPGYEASLDYVAGRLEAAGYAVQRQEFHIPTFVVRDEPALSRLAPDPLAFPADQISTFGSSGSGLVTATLQAIDLKIPPAGDNDSSSACQDADFAGFEPGSVALIQRGSCPYAQKVNRALGAGAAAVILFNEGSPNRQGTLLGSAGAMRQIPILGASYAVGEALAASLAATDTVTVRLEAWGDLEHPPTWNLLAETPGGREDRVVLLGGHLDSVGGGPGINDNGSGSAVILEMALQVAELGIQPVNRLRFAFWGGEELGLLGSRHYVEQLSEAERADILANLNLDMVGSPNFFRGIYDGDGSIGGEAEGGPAGSGEIEQVLAGFFDARGLPHDPTAFDGRSDYGPFIAVGVPAGGLFTGAEGNKSARMAERYGGTADQAYDPCYHRACDTIDNVSWEVLDEMADAVAHATLALAMDRYIPLVNGRLGRFGLEGPVRPAPRGLMLPWLQR